MVNRKKSDYAPHIPPEQAQTCQREGCAELGTYKAPHSREDLHDYQWFCLEHIREHNAKWDYFAGLDSNEIESFIKDATTGHRPTWNRESRMRQQYSQLQDALYEFLQADGNKAPRPSPPLSDKLRKALSALDLNYPYNEQELKVKYRIMVKKYHPDVNKGNKQLEETFKYVTSSYRYLLEHLKNS